MNLYKSKIYTVDFAILKASDYADKNKINANDYEELIRYLAEEQEKQMVEEQKENTIQKWKVKEIEEVGQWIAQ